MNRREAILRRMAEVTGERIEVLALWFEYDELETVPRETLRAAAEDFERNRDVYREMVA